MSNRTFAWIMAGLVLLFAVGCGAYYLGRSSVEGVQISADSLTGEVLPQATDSQLSSQTARKADRLNINIATKEELIALPGVGEATAQNILDYRTENGRFSSVEELLNVSGIGDKKLQAIRDLITVSGG